MSCGHDGSSALASVQTTDSPSLCPNAQNFICRSEGAASLAYGAPASAEEGQPERPELRTIDHQSLGLMRLPHVCGEVIKELVAASPPVNRTKGSVAEVSQGFGGSVHKGTQPSVWHWTLCVPK